MTFFRPQPACAGTISTIRLVLTLTLSICIARPYKTCRGASHFCTLRLFRIQSVVSPPEITENLLENAPSPENAYYLVVCPTKLKT